LIDRHLPFKIAAPSMVFGHDTVENARGLSDVMSSVEILLFHTPALHNIPDPAQIRALKKIGEEKGTVFSIHLPTSLEIASSDGARRDESVRLIRDICLKTIELHPIHYVLHIPFTPPTLAPVPDLYFKSGDPEQWRAWARRGLSSLAELRDLTDHAVKFLVENINYSPVFLEPFWEDAPCRFCLDIGHLLLGDEPVSETLEAYSEVTEEIHIHGVIGYEEHISLSVLPKHRVRKWLKHLLENSFTGIVNFEVFSPQDLTESLKFAFELCEIALDDEEFKI
jgi:sugar phosphate isomerase/epimerase